MSLVLPPPLSLASVDVVILATRAPNALSALAALALATSRSRRSAAQLSQADMAERVGWSKESGGTSLETSGSEQFSLDINDFHLMPMRAPRHMGQTSPDVRGPKGGPYGLLGPYIQANGIPVGPWPWRSHRWNCFDHDRLAVRRFKIGLQALNSVPTSVHDPSPLKRTWITLWESRASDIRT